MRLACCFVVSLSVSVVGCGSIQVQADAALTVDAAVDAAADAALACTPGTTARCDGDTLISCDAQGVLTGMTACPLGCNAGAARCGQVDPSNGLASALDDAATAPDLILSGDATIDTTNGTITDGTGGRVVPSSMLPIALGMFVIKVKSFATGGAVTVTGTRSLAIVSTGDVKISHRLSVSATGGTGGPGAYTCAAGSAAAGNSEGSSGGGGGGFGTAGGAGGAGGSPTVAAGAGGATTGQPTLVPLRGGCAGGRASAASASFAAGGGGGALQIVSGTAITITPMGSISANGGGGRGPIGPILCLANTPCGNGEGGGSGGAVLLEAPAVTIEAGGGIYANGGGGSCSVYGAAAPGQDATTPAAGQTCAGQTGSGGNGAAGATGATPGASKTGLDAVGGGGGGGLGRVRVNLPAGSVFSPAGVVSGVQTLGALTAR